MFIFCHPVPFYSLEHFWDNVQGRGQVKSQALALAPGTIRAKSPLDEANGFQLSLMVVNGPVGETALRIHIDVAGGGDQNPNPSLYAIEAGVWSRLSEAGTNVSAWHAAIGRLTLMGAILAGLITDARLTDPKHPPIASPGGYFRGMVLAGERGELNLLSSFMGLLARRAREEEQGSRDENNRR